MKHYFFSALTVLVLFSCKTKNNQQSASATKDDFRIDSIQPGRRIVTGFDNNGKSVITSDGPAPQAACWNDPQWGKGYQAWVIRDIPSALKDTDDPVKNGYDTLEPPEAGLVARITTWLPGVKYPMHQTNTTDFGIVISGKLQLGLESDSTVIGPGDVVVQRGTPHSWTVVGDKPCTIAFILVDAKKGK